MPGSEPGRPGEPDWLWLGEDGLPASPLRPFFELGVAWLFPAPGLGAPCPGLVPVPLPFWPEVDWPWVGLFDSSLDGLPPCPVVEESPGWPGPGVVASFPGPKLFDSGPFADVDDGFVPPWPGFWVEPGGGVPWLGDGDWPPGGLIPLGLGAGGC